jgi:hypothetical protein
LGRSYSLATALIILAGGEAPTRALELYGMLAQDPLCVASRWFEDGVRPHLAAVTAALPEDEVAAALARGGTQDPRATVHALADEVRLLGWE